MSIRAATVDFWQARMPKRQPHHLVPPHSIPQNPGKTMIPRVGKSSRGGLVYGKRKISDFKDVFTLQGPRSSTKYVIDTKKL